MSVAKIDTDLYSRQIGTFGMEAMGKLIQMKVLIVGLRGLGVEIAKNLILAGPASVVLHDDELAEMRDLGSNFYLTEADVGARRRSEACVKMLTQLNPYVAVSVHSGALTEEVLAGFSVVVCTGVPRRDLIKYNEFCRSRTPAVGFIAADCFGVAGSAFVDYGDSFAVFDKDGEEPRHAIVAGISKENPGAVACHQDKRHGFQDGDYVTFREVQGMTELNGSKPRQIAVTGPYSFTIEDTGGYSAYVREGIVSQAKVPSTMKFSSYSRCAVHPGSELAVPDLAKFGRSEQLHIAMQALMEYRDSHGELPPVRDAGAAAEVVKLAQDINAARKKEGDAALSVDEVDEDVVKKVALFARCMIAPMSAFLGGIVAQEVVKFTGKYTPLHQCLYFDMFELVPNEDPADCKLFGSRYDDQIAILGQAYQTALGNMQLFLVGAGALGCEYLKCFALMGVCCGENGKATVTDMDRIEVSNLNRQFLFRQADVGNHKSDVAAAFINRRLGHLGIKVRAHVGKIQDKDESFYRQFNLVIAGLDNIAARRWMNATLHDMVDRTSGEPDPSTVIPLLDGGTEGFKGQARVIVPFMTSCFDCSLDAFPPQVNFPLCTIAETPRLPEHCIEYALVVMWDKQFPGRKVNTDSPVDMKWLHEQASERADTFGILGVTYQLTMGVVKRIIPAIASTNALISAALVGEALKISTYCGPVLNNYMMYMGQAGVYTHTFEYEKKSDCMVCGGAKLALTRPPSSTLQELLDALTAHPSYQLSRPSVSGSSGVIFIQNPAPLRKQHEYKLSMTLEELTKADPPVFAEDEELVVTDPALPSRLTLRVSFG
mmetsp:Transcript_39870/g.105459  ORF Transcript_39870/g.105459 Transcript_39870/m.105459 type:complete len:828 (-) Transcript_39870:26-2509(-)